MSDNVLPDPNGKPKAPDAGFGLGDVIGGIAAVGACLFILGAFMTPTLGSTRSTRLQWEERQRQMEEAAKAASDPEDPNEVPAPAQEIP